VTVVTGFLGSGKTTLLQRFLATPEGQGTAVIINEFGAVGIDDALVRDSSEETVLLGNGCVCCITRTDLQAAQRRLVFDRERGTVPPFHRVVIETSGLADPGPILQTFSTDRALGGEFHIDVVLTVVDAVNGEAALERASEARKQVILADRLIVSKTDLAEPAAVERLTRRLQALNPRATIDVAVKGALDPQRVIAPPGGERSGFVAEAEHSDGITSFVVARQTPMAWLTFARQRHSQRRRLPRPGGGAIRPASRPSAGRAGRLAGSKPRQPRSVHHARYCGARGARPVRRGRGAGNKWMIGGFTRRTVFPICAFGNNLRRSGCSGAGNLNRHMAGPA